MKTILLPLAVHFLAVPHLWAELRTSQNYHILSEVTGIGGGGSAASSSYSQNGSLGGITGITTTAPGAALKTGYTAQLYEVEGIQITAPATLAEQSASQLAASALLDDGSLLHGLEDAVSWSLLSGPLASLTPQGLLTADAVYQDTPASLQSTWRGGTGSLEVTVLDTLPDNFGAYAADGLPDSWQVLHFGLQTGAAGPLDDYDQDGLSNLLEWACGLHPAHPSPQPLNIEATTTQVAFTYQRLVQAVQAGIAFDLQLSTDLDTEDNYTGPRHTQLLTDDGTLQTLRVSVPQAGIERIFARLQITATPAP